MMRALLCLAIAILLPSTPVSAHAMLEKAEPSVGSEVSTPPTQLVLTFTEGVEPLFTTVQVRDPAGADLAIGKPRIEPGNDRKLVVQLPVLGRGKYTVTWRATSVDTHKTQGSFQFTVGQ
jgi:methionine-rich copper-binding protein CopC